ncbi:hypothetical protein C1H46_013191 [Malus baccata]|uniref:E3 ubiquitin-protein ligase RMA n=1 Tax=Malus baccata TaxID=106549 RepID=A0A540MQX0_MALBA|nr:hypothetical protein C1H46_013191 [Malus baccata]
MASNFNHKSIIPPKVRCAFKPSNPRMRGSKKFKRFRFRNLPQEESQHFSSSSGSEIKRYDDPFEYEAYSAQSVDCACSPDHSGYVTCEPESCELDDDAGSYLPEPQQGYEQDKSCHDHDCESSQLDGDHDEFCHFDDDLGDDDCKPEYHEVIYPEPEEDDYGEPYFPELEQEYDYFYGSQVKPCRTRCKDYFYDSICDSSSSHERELEYNKTYDDKASFYSVSSPDQPLSSPRPAKHFDSKLWVKMAREPVVTQCGHLFCGDCLNKWLYFFTSEMQCPVCRSKVLDYSIIQISPPPWWQQRP